MSTSEGRLASCLANLGPELTFVGGRRLPLSDAVWVMFFRGMVFGFFGGLVLILLFFWSGKYGGLAAARPICFLYFLAGVEVGIAVIGMVVFAGFASHTNTRPACDGPIEKRRRVMATRLAGRFWVPGPKLPVCALTSYREFSRFSVSILHLLVRLSVEQQLSSELERQTNSTRKDKQNAIHGHRQSHGRHRKRRRTP